MLAYSFHRLAQLLCHLKQHSPVTLLIGNIIEMQADKSALSNQQWDLDADLWIRLYIKTEMCWFVNFSVLDVIFILC